MSGSLNADSPEIYKLLVEQVRDYAIFLLDTEGYVRSWNEGAYRIKGYERKDIIGKHFSVFYTKQDIDNKKPAFELRMAQELGRYQDEGWRVRKDGSHFWANVIITPMRDSQGELSGFAKMTRDLTQQKLQEENLQRLLEAEEKFRLFVEQVKDYAIFFLDAKGNVSSWNQGAKRIKGYSSDEIIGRHFSVFYPPEDIARHHPEHELARAVQEGHYEEEGWRIKKDGSRFWANVVITSLWDKRGNLTGFAKVTRDLTTKKREELAMQQKTVELEAFAHTLSHDLRGPVRSISGFAHILKETQGVSGDEKTDYADKIIRAASSMSDMISGMLKLSQVSMAPLDEERLALGEVLHECLGFLNHEITTSGADIKLIEPFPFIRTNRILLVQIFSNLLNNAMRFAAPGQKPRIEIYAKKVGDRCETHVKDYGIGIPRDAQQSIFNLFDRGGARADNQGLGIGLTIVKRAAERLGGKVTVVSKEGEGSDFVVTTHCEFANPELQMA